MEAVEFQWGGETLVAMAGRALWWPRRNTLCVADLHLGKSAAFRSAGLPVPEATTDADLRSLSEMEDRLQPSRLVILGDFLHARSGRMPATMNAFREWRESRSSLDVLLVRGNHDRHAGDPPAEWSVRVENEPFADQHDGLITLAHDPRSTDDRSDGFVLCGHIHPAVSMVGLTRQVRAPCFWFGTRLGVLPAFGSFTGTSVVAPTRGDRVFAIGYHEVVEVVGTAGLSARESRGRRMRRSDP